MVKFENWTLNDVQEKYKKGDNIVFLLKEEEKSEIYYIDSFIIDYNFNLIDLFSQMKEIYHYNKEKNNEVYMTNLITKEELEDKEFMKEKNIIFLK